MAGYDQTDRVRPLLQMLRKEELGGSESNLSIQPGFRLEIVGRTLKGEHPHLHARALQLAGHDRGMLQRDHIIVRSMDE